jgi:hypothetical protein
MRIKKDFEDELSDDFVFFSSDGMISSIGLFSKLIS